MTPPPSDADKPGSGNRKPDAGSGRPGQPNSPGGDAKVTPAPATPAPASTASTASSSTSSATGGVKPAAPGSTASAPQGAGQGSGQGSSQGSGMPPRPATEPVVAAKPGSTDAKPDAGKPGFGATGPKPATGPTAQPVGRPDAVKADTTKFDTKTEPPRAGIAGSTGAAAAKPGSATSSSGSATSSSTASTASGASAAGPKVGTEPPKAGQPSAGPQAGTRPGGPTSGAAGTVAAGAVTAGPIIDMKASRVPDTSTSGKDAGKDAGRDGGKGGKEPPKGPGPAAAAAAGSTAGAVPSARARAGFGSLAAAGLLGGVIGAGLLFGAEKAGIGPDPRLNALDQKLTDQIASLDKRLDGLAPRDAVGALDKRVAAAEAAAKQASEKGGVPVAASPDGQPSSAPATAVPADLVARLDSLDQRVAALQEEPGRDQPAESKLNAVQDGGRPLADLDARVKALEGSGADKGAAEDAARKIAALQGEVEQKTKANAEADAALGQRLDSLQQALDARVKAATEAVQAATQASRTAAEAGQTQAAETAKAVDRRLQEQADKIAALDKSVAQRAEAGTVQAALRVVVADRVAAALESGMPYAEPLATLRRLDPGADAQAQALAPFADTGAPTASRLADAFRPVAERIAAKRQAQRAKSAAETGDFRSKLLSMADGLVQVRKVDAPAASETSEDPEHKVQAALDRNDLPAASAAFAALPAEAQEQAGDFGAKLKTRAEAEQAVRTLLDSAFKALPTPAASAGR